MAARRRCLATSHATGSAKPEALAALEFEIATRRVGGGWSHRVEIRAEWSPDMAPTPTEAEFTEFVEHHGAELRHAFVARYGPDVGADVMSDVTEYGWLPKRRVAQDIEFTGSAWTLAVR